MNNFVDKLQSVEDRYDELNELLADPDVISDSQKFTELSKEEASIRETVAKFREGIYYRYLINDNGNVDTTAKYAVIEANGNILTLQKI